MNICVKCYGYHYITDGFREFKLKHLYFYKEDGTLIEFPFSNVMGCWFEVDVNEIKAHRNVNYDKEELFAVRSDEKGFWDVYIPFSRSNCRKIGEKTEILSDYEYIYDTYQVNGGNLKLFSNGDLAFKECGDDGIAFYFLKNYKPTTERERFNKLMDDIEKTCGICVNTYQMKHILKHYRLVKIRKKVE